MADSSKNNSDRIWFQLVDGSKLPLPNTKTTSVFRSDLPDVDVVDFRKAVHKEFANSKLEKIAAAELNVYKDRAALEADDALDDEAPILEGYGATIGTAMMVKVPSSTSYTTVPRTTVDSWMAGFKASIESTPRQSILGGSLRPPHLVLTSGSDFVFSDRTDSFDKLALSTQNRFLYKHQRDRNKHPIPFLADGPGSGKSRFLQELPLSFMNFIGQQTKYSVLKGALDNALFINITFGNGTSYLRAEASIPIEFSIATRMMFEMDANNQPSFGSFQSAFEPTPLLFDQLINSIARSIDGCSAIVLGIDEVNKVYDEDKTKLMNLLNVLGSRSCHSPGCFFVPIIAGTVVGPLKEYVSTKSKHPPLRIPLPLLSYDSCVEIFCAKDGVLKDRLRNDKRFQVVLAEIGGHCRSLEFLYDSIVQTDARISNFWDQVSQKVVDDIGDRYAMRLIDLSDVIAISFLSLPTNMYSICTTARMTSDELEETGTIKLNKRAGISFVEIPFVFIRVFMKSTKFPETAWKPYAKIIGLEEDIVWKQWERFNQKYFACRTTLYGQLRCTQIRLTDFFDGCHANIPKDCSILIPDANSVVTKDLSARFPGPSKEGEEPFNPQAHVGTWYLNASGAPFDVFSIFEKTDGSFILIAIQAKLFSAQSVKQQVIDSKMINDEYLKVNTSISKYLSGMDFVLVISGRCDANFDPIMLPSKCVVMARGHQRQFLGNWCYNRLNIEEGIITIEDECQKYGVAIKHV